MRIRNIWFRPLRGPDNSLIEVGEVFEAPRDWVAARGDRFRRGQFEIVDDAVGESTENCAGTTKSGKPCKASPVEGSQFCHHHQPQE